MNFPIMNQVPFSYNPNFMMNNMLNNPSQINLMAQPAINVKSIIQPYEKKIKELEEIIKKKNIEITALTQKLNIYEKNGIIFNRPILNNSINIPQNINKNDEISIAIQFNIKNIKCSKKQIASVIEDKLDLKNINLTFNYKPISFNETIEENGIYEGSIINITNQIYNIDFMRGENHCLINLDGECPFKVAVVSYCEKAKDPKLYYKALKNKITFLYIHRLNILDETPIKDIFRGYFNPRIYVLDTIK